MYTGFGIKDFLTSGLDFKFPEAIALNYWQIKKECVVQVIVITIKCKMV